MLSLVSVGPVRRRPDLRGQEVGRGISRRAFKHINLVFFAVFASGYECMWVKTILSTSPTMMALARKTCLRIASSEHVTFA